MKTLSQGRTARLRAAVDRYQAIDFDEPHKKRVRKTAPKCAPQSRMPRLEGTVGKSTSRGVNLGPNHLYHAKV